MRHITKLLMGGVLATSLVAGCNGDDLTNEPDGRSAPIPAPLPTPTPEPISGPPTAAVTVGDIFFESGHNGSSDPAVDTVAVNGTVTWTWASTEALPHSVQSLGSPSFTSSGIQAGPGQTYSFTFTTEGTYEYNCAVHGQIMRGQVVVLRAATTQ